MLYRRIAEGLPSERILERRTAQLAEELDIDRTELRAWGVVRAVLSGFWSMEDHGRWWEHALVVAEVLSALC